MSSIALASEKSDVQRHSSCNRRSGSDEIVNRVAEVPANARPNDIGKGFAPEWRSIK
jgi:hypothetical protein